MKTSGAMRLHIASYLRKFSLGKIVDQPIYKSWTKGTTAESGLPRYSANWVNARRGWFKIFPDRVECGDWVIPAIEIQEAVLYEARQWFMPVYILAISTSEKTWQFGFNPWARVSSYLPFTFRRERIQLGYSWFSIAIRALLIIYVVYWLWFTFKD